ncbi:MAG TPA: hypothetical protein VK970_16320 [Candidatus Methylacidiphilales bacterium]|nr:hypothetical protein [Candidatus Methylacidiphilales bacterium]
MQLSLTPSALAVYTQRQLQHFFPDDASVSAVAEYLDKALQRMDYCFSFVHDKYFKRDGQSQFDHLHSDQYAMYLYFLANTIYLEHGDPSVCNKLYYLNKALNGIDLYHAIEMPDIFMFSHPVGSVLGRAKYGNFLLIYQNCTVGSNHDVNYPILGEYVALYRGASVLGTCRVGNNCKIASGSTLLDTDLPDNSIFIGDKLNPLIKTSRRHDAIWDSEKAHEVRPQTPSPMQ